MHFLQYHINGCVRSFNLFGFKEFIESNWFNPMRNLNLYSKIIEKRLNQKEMKIARWTKLYTQIITNNYLQIL